MCIVYFVYHKSITQVFHTFQPSFLLEKMINLCIVLRILSINFKELNYFNLELSLKIPIACRPEHFDGSEIPATTEGFELHIFCMYCSFFAHFTISPYNLSGLGNCITSKKPSNPPVVTEICDPSESPA